MTPEELAHAGEDVPLLEGIRTARAIRRLRPDPVPRELIRKVCEAGTFAPSGGNRQPWLFVAVTDPERRAFVAERYLRAFRAYIAPALEAAKQPGFDAAKRRNIDGALYLAEHCTRRRSTCSSPATRAAAQPQVQALFPAIQNVLLACRAVGLGASLTTVHLAYGEEIDASSGCRRKRPAVRCCRSAGRRAATAARRGAASTSACSSRNSSREISASRSWRARRRTRSSASRRGRGSSCEPSRSGGRCVRRAQLLDQLEVRDRAGLAAPAALLPARGPLVDASSRRAGCRSRR